MRLVICIVFLFMLLLSPDRCAAAASQALAIWGLDVVPSLFPYMVLCRLGAKYTRRYGVPALAAVPLLGLLGGSPSGASVMSVYLLDGSLSRRTARALCALVGGISPAFLLSTIRRWGLDSQFCSALFMVSLLSAAAASAAVYFMPEPHGDEEYPRTLKQPDSDSDPIMQSVLSVLGVGGCLVFFSVAGEWASILLGRFFEPLLPALIHAALEMSGGIHKLTTLALDRDTLFILCSAIAGFSGVSILIQNHQQLSRSGIRLQELLSYALLRSGFAVLFAVSLIRLQS